MNWEVPRDDGGLSITQYVVYWRIGDGPETTASIMAALPAESSINYTITGLSAGMIYRISVAARNSAGLGARSNELVSQAAIAPPGPPESVND